MPPQAAKWAETLSSTLTDLALPCRDDGPVAPRNCPLGGHDHGARGCQNVQQGSEELDAAHQSAATIMEVRHAGKSPINQNGKGGANPGHGGSYMTLVSMRPSPGGLRSE
jgi:hypothetical protein